MKAYKWFVGGNNFCADVYQINPKDKIYTKEGEKWKVEVLSNYMATLNKGQALWKKKHPTASLVMRLKTNDMVVGEFAKDDEKLPKVIKDLVLHRCAKHKTDKIEILFMVKKLNSSGIIFIRPDFITKEEGDQKSIALLQLLLKNTKSVKFLFHLLENWLIMVLVINGMIQNVIEISTDNKELSAYRGFLRIKECDKVIKDIPFDTIHAIFITARGVVYTSNLLQALCEYRIPLIILGKNFLPSGILTSFVGQQKQTEIQQIQIESSKPLQKQLWAEIVKEKIKNQSRVLDLFGKENKIKNLWNEVLSGDTTNIEGQVARYYFHTLFGDGFVRNTDKGGINSFLNYGYAIIMACVARFVVAGGLNPSFGIQHHNKLNPFCLVDDLMEPYRPLIDVKVYKMFEGKDNERQELTTKYKREFAELLHKEFKNGNGDDVSELITIIQNDIWAFVKSLKNKKPSLSFNKYLITY